jgi:hypothetical protein
MPATTFSERASSCLTISGWAAPKTAVTRHRGLPKSMLLRPSRLTCLLSIFKLGRCRLMLKCGRKLTSRPLSTCNLAFLFPLPGKSLSTCSYLTVLTCKGTKTTTGASTTTRASRNTNASTTATSTPSHGKTTAPTPASSKSNPTMSFWPSPLPAITSSPLRSRTRAASTPSTSTPRRITFWN